MTTMAFFALTLLPTLAFAHFSILYPTPRGTEMEDQMTNYPCGAYPRVSNTRTPYPLTGGAPITIDNEHTESHVSAVLALGSNPGPGDFVYPLIPTVETMGPRDFCMGDVDVMGALMRAGRTNVSVEMLDGMEATIMVSTDSHGEDEGLYNCADITLTPTPLTTQSYNQNCINATGVTSSSLSDGTSVNANGTAVGGGTSTSSGSEGDGESDSEPGAEGGGSEDDGSDTSDSSDGAEEGSGAGSGGSGASGTVKAQLPVAGLLALGVAVGAGVWVL